MVVGTGMGAQITVRFFCQRGGVQRAPGRGGCAQQPPTHLNFRSRRTHAPGAQTAPAGAGMGLASLRLAGGPFFDLESLAKRLGSSAPGATGTDGAGAARGRLERTTAGGAGRRGRARPAGCGRLSRGGDGGGGAGRGGSRRYSQPPAAASIAVTRARTVLRIPSMT